MSPYGKPLEAFIICPPKVLSKQERADLGVHALGLTLFELGRQVHVLDWIGGNYYPNVTDFLEEVRRFGMSRRMSSHTDFKLLQPGARFYLLHGRAQIGNWADYYGALLEEFKGNSPYRDPLVRRCPKCINTHDTWLAPKSMCAQLWWQDVENGKPLVEGRAYDNTRSWRRITREMPSFKYDALHRPYHVITEPPVYVLPDYTPAIFASFPISRLVVIRSPGDGKHEEVAKLASLSGLPIAFEDE